MAAAIVLLAAGVLVAPGAAARGRLAQLDRPLGPVAAAARRPDWLVPVAGFGAAGAVVAAIGGAGGVVLGVAVGALVAGAVVRHLRREPPPPSRLQLAGAWELLAACLRAGLPTVIGVRAVSARLPATASAQLERVADLLLLGAHPATAWAAAEGLPGAAGLVRAARRSATSGAGLADVAAAAATEARAAAADAAEAGAQRAAVAVAGPLGLCFLPAFLALGVVPVVIGLAQGLLARW
jgi:pilus assembly protein TadC